MSDFTDESYLQAYVRLYNEIPFNRSRPKKASNTVSNANLVNARELEITAVTTVSELFDLIDLPYRITKHAIVSIKAVQSPVSFEPTRWLRIEWRGDGA